MLSKGSDRVGTVRPEMDGELITSLFLLEDTEYCLQGEVGRVRKEEPEETLVGTATFRLGPEWDREGSEQALGIQGWTPGMQRRGWSQRLFPPLWQPASAGLKSGLRGSPALSMSLLSV